VRARVELDRRGDVRRALVRPAFDRLALVRPAFELAARLGVEAVFERLLLAGASLAGCLFDCFVDPDRAGLDRFVFAL
jgi:hypothetical protein